MFEINNYRLYPQSEWTADDQIAYRQWLIQWSADPVQRQEGQALDTARAFRQWDVRYFMSKRKSDDARMGLLMILGIDKVTNTYVVCNAMDILHRPDKVPGTDVLIAGVIALQSGAYLAHHPDLLGLSAFSKAFGYVHTLAPDSDDGDFAKLIQGSVWRGCETEFPKILDTWTVGKYNGIKLVKMEFTAASVFPNEHLLIG